MVHQSILATEERIAALLAKDVLNDSHRQSVIRISTMLKTMCTKLKGHHYEIVAGIRTDEASMQEKAFFHEHQHKTMEFMDRIGNFLAKPQPNLPPQIQQMTVWWTDSWTS